MTNSTRALFVFVGLLLLVPFLYSCNPEFEETINVRVLTNRSYPIPNAPVSISYQYMYTLPRRVVTHFTNEKGIATFNVRNSEKMASRVDCNIIVATKYMGKSASKTIVPVYHEHPVDLRIDAYRVTVLPVDQNNKPLDNVTVLVDGVNVPKKYGRFFMVVTQGKHIFTLIYRGSKSSRVMYVNRDATVSLQFSNYKLTLRLVDDAGRPIHDADVDVNGMSCNLTDKGVCTLEDISMPSARVTVRRNGKTFSKTFDITTYRIHTFPLDITPPKIESLNYTRKRSDLQFEVHASDNQEYSSGIENVKVRYTVDGEVSGHRPDVFVKRNDVYGFTIPYPGVNHKMTIEIYVSDGVGNYAKKVYVLDIHEESLYVPPKEDNTHPSENETSGQEKHDVIEIFPIKIPTTILVVLGVLISIGGLYYLYKWKTNE